MQTCRRRKRTFHRYWATRSAAPWNSLQESTVRQSAHRCSPAIAALQSFQFHQSAFTFCLSLVWRKSWAPKDKLSIKTILTTWHFAVLKKFAIVGSKFKLRFDILDNIMRYSLTNEILCKSCMHSISLKINSARDRKTAQHLHAVFSSSPAHTTHRSQGCTEQDCHQPWQTSFSCMFLLIFILIPLLLTSYEVLKSWDRKYLWPSYLKQLLSVIKELSAQPKHYSDTCSNAALKILPTTSKVPGK